MAGKEIIYVIWERVGPIDAADNVIWIKSVTPETFKTREKADNRGKELENENPGWSYPVSEIELKSGMVIRS
jgi:hypothetical protein